MTCLPPWFRLLSPCVAVLLSACQSMGGAYLSATELQPFDALPQNQRIMNTVKVRWEVRQDVQTFCAQAMRLDQSTAYFTPPLACAMWNVSRSECTIVTGPSTSHLALGHELRHCFEGQFHS